MPGLKGGQKPGVAARQGGGFRGGFGHFNEEHMEQQAMASSAQQHQLQQQTSNAAQTTAGGSAIQTGGVSQETPQSERQDAREVDTIKEEGKRAVKDVIGELKGFFSLKKLLDIKTDDTPEEKQKKEAVLKRFNKLTDDQKRVAQEKYQAKMKKEKADEEERQAKKQKEAQEKQAGIAPPSSPKKGAVGPGGSKKQKAATQLQQNRQTIGKVQGAN